MASSTSVTAAPPPPASLGDVVRLLPRLGAQPIGVAALRAILDVEGDKFKQRLSAAQLGDPEALRSLLGVCAALNERTATNIIACGASPPPPHRLVAIGKEYGVTLAALAERGAGGAAAEKKAALAGISALLRRFEGQGELPLPSPSDVPAKGSSASANDSSAREFASVHIYGGSNVISFSADVHRKKYQTLCIDAGEIIAGKEDWQNKISVQLTRRELPDLLSFLALRRPSFAAKGHGVSKDKWVTMERQESHLFISVNMRGVAPRCVPIRSGDAYCLLALLSKQMLKNDPHFNMGDLLTIASTLSALDSYPPGRGDNVAVAKGA